jgi:hypothetical protein
MHNDNEIEVTLAETMVIFLRRAAFDAADAAHAADLAEARGMERPHNAPKHEDVERLQYHAEREASLRDEAEQAKLDAPLLAMARLDARIYGDRTLAGLVARYDSGDASMRAIALEEIRDRYSDEEEFDIAN